MSWFERFVAAVIVIGYIALLWTAWKVGIREFFDKTASFVRRVMDGPEKVPDNATPPECLILHENARAEIEVYGRIMSWSVEKHLRDCPANIFDLEPKKPLPPKPFATHRAKGEVS